jgi:2-haloacid dehalogenase
VDAAEVADSWRAQYQPSMEPIRAGARQYVPLDTLHRESLEKVLTSQGVETSDVTGDDLPALAKSWRYLPPWPDSVPESWR